MMCAPDPSAFMTHTALPSLNAIWLASGDHDGLWPDARTCWGFDPSASMTQICPSFSNTILPPSGAHFANQFPKWAPDGGKIAFEQEGQIWVIDVDGAKRPQGRASGHTPQWPHAAT